MERSYSYNHRQSIAVSAGRDPAILRSVIQKNKDKKVT